MCFQIIHLTLIIQDEHLGMCPHHGQCETKDKAATDTDFEMSPNADISCIVIKLLVKYFQVLFLYRAYG